MSSRDTGPVVSFGIAPQPFEHPSPLIQIMKTGTLLLHAYLELGLDCNTFLSNLGYGSSPSQASAPFKTGSWKAAEHIFTF